MRVTRMVHSASARNVIILILIFFCVELSQCLEFDTISLIRASCLPGGGSAYPQRLCHDGATDLPTSWCELKNPFSVPITTFQNSFPNHTHYCESEEDIMEECIYAKKVRAASMGGIANQTKLVLSSTVDHFALAFELEQQSATIISEYDYGAEILDIVSISGNNTFSAIIVGKSNILGLYGSEGDSGLDMSFNKSFEGVITHLELVSLPHNASEWGDDLFLVGILIDYGSMRKIQFYLYGADKAGDVIIYGDFSWDIVNHNPTSKNLTFGFFDHILDSQSNVTQSNYKRVMVSLHDNRFCHIYGFPVTKDILMNKTIDFGQEGSETFFYEAEDDEEIINTSFFSEQTNRFENTGSENYESPSCNIWIAILLDRQGNYTMKVLQLGEFRQYNEDPNIIENIDDPAQKDPSFTSCLPNYWYHRATVVEGAGCKLRYFVEEVLDFVPNEVKSRYIGEPITTLNQTSVPSIFSKESEGLYKTPENRDSDTKDAKDTKDFNFNRLFDLFETPEDSTSSSSEPSLSSSSSSEEEEVSQVEFMTENFYQHILFISDMENNVFIYSLQQSFCTMENAIYDSFNRLAFWGRVFSFTITENGQHLFAAIPLSKYIIESMVRTLEICDKLDDDPEDVFLQDFKGLCGKVDNMETHAPDIGTFMYYSSMCPPGTSCPNLEGNVINPVAEGDYTIRSLFMDNCPAGYFCPGGMLTKCPNGFICPNESMVLPEKCPISSDLNITCYDEGLKEPISCPEGTVCPVSSYMPVPVPPGYFMLDIDSFAVFKSFRICDNGTYCPMGRSIVWENSTHQSYKDDIICPAYTFCSNTSVLEPTVCYYNITEMSTSYCPNGTMEEISCPGGWFCPDPSQKISCGLTQYCPEGSMVYQTCPRGYYCPTPSEKVICPAFHFCPDGSVGPILCPPLTWCPQGTAVIWFDVRFTVLVLIVAIIIVIIFWSTLRIRDLRRNLREKKRKKLQEQYKDMYGEPMDKLAAAFSVLTDERTPRFPISYKFFDLGLKLKKKPHSVVLQGINGEIKAGRVTAIMGPSGCGKTTLLNVLCGKAQAYADTIGEIHINDNVVDNIDNYRLWFGFVPQDDVMLRELSVKEIIRNSALLRLPRSLSWSRKRERAQKVIEVLGLDHIRHSYIGDETKRGISGGQRKRVNIGMELVASPGFIALDEPTSGLDSGSSKDVVEVCSYVAKNLGVAVVMVIHQPRIEIFELFDDLILLGKGGQLTYMGPANESVDYFSKIGFPCPPHVNPPDFLLDVIVGAVPHPTDEDFEKEKLFDLWKVHFRETQGKLFKGSGKKKHSIRRIRSAISDVGITNVTENIHDGFGSLRGRLLSNQNDDDATSRYIELEPIDEEEEIDGEQIKIGGKSGKAKIPKRKTTFWFFQILIFFWRGIIQQTRDTWGFIFDILLVFIPGLLVGLVYNKKYYIGPVPDSISNVCPGDFKAVCSLPRSDPFPAIDMLCCLTISLTGMTSGLKVFGNEKIVYWREVSTGATSTLTYFLGKNLSHIPMQILMPLVFTSTFYTFVEPRGWFFWYFGILLILQFVSTGFGYIISILFNQSISQLVAVIFTLISLLFCGASPTLRELYEIWIPFRWFPWLSFLRYGEEALYLMELWNFRDVYDCSISLNFMNYDWWDFYWCLGVLIALVFVTRGVALCLMYMKDRKKKK